MEIFILSILILIIFFFNSRLGSVRKDTDYLYRKVKNLEEQLLNQGIDISTSDVKRKTASIPSTEIIAPEDLLEFEEAPLGKKEDFKVSSEDLAVCEQPDETDIQISEVIKNKLKKPAKEKPVYSFEQNIATKLPVWIGAISLICAAFFLVKYSMELNLLSPAVRIAMGGVFGLALLGVGQWFIKNDKLANAERISQGLVGAGLVSLYVTIYAALNLYSMVPPLVGFGAMAAVTALAVIMSLRHGQPIAVFGLLGGLLTPALVGSDDPNALVLFTYLFLLFSSMFIVLARKGWWTLALLAVIGVFCWSGVWFWLAFAAAEAFVLILFAMAVTMVILAVTGKSIARDDIEARERPRIHALNITAIAGGVITILWLSFEVTLSLFDWSMLGLFSLAIMALAYFKPAIYQMPLWIKLATSLLLFAVWAESAPLSNAVAVLTGMAALYVGGGAFIMRRVQDPRFWAALQAITAIALYIISYFILDIPEGFLKSFGSFWGILSLILAGLSIFQAADIREKYKADTTICDHLVTIYALTASAFISMGLAIELPWEYVPMAIAGQITATAWIYCKSQIDFLKKIMRILTALFIVLNYKQILLFLSIIVTSLVGDAPSAHDVGSYMFDVPLIKLGVPAILMTIALWLLKTKDEISSWTAKALMGTITALVMAAIYYQFRMMLHPDSIAIFASAAGFIERGFITIACAGVGVIALQVHKKYGYPYLETIGTALFYIGMLRFAYYDMFIMNPYWDSSQFVGEMPLLNGITLTYGIGGLLAGWATLNPAFYKNKTLFQLLGYVSLFAFTSLTVHQYFNGGYMTSGVVSPIELYSYSVAWLLAGIALLAIGIKWHSKATRMASLAFMILTILKVFLFDAAELEGLYRVFSFLGLGVSLMGLSFFYTKFVFSGELVQKQE